MNRDKVIVLDFGAQYSQLIARRVRELGVYCEILPYHTDLSILKGPDIRALILSGGPSSVLAADAPKIDKKIFELDKPLLGICYGMQFMAWALGGKVVTSQVKEYGHSIINIQSKDALFHHIPNSIKVWMSHGDVVQEIPAGFQTTSISENGLISSMSNEAKKLYAVQFHPEVTHTDHGRDILHAFIFEVAHAEKNWDIGKFIEEKSREIRDKAGDKTIVCGVSGGVDSTVMAYFLSNLAHKKLHCIFVNNGVLRKDEPEEVIANFKKLGIEVDYVDASERFLKKLKGVEDPEEKRKIIGREFVDVFFKHAGHVDFLAQGTLYPDVIESVSVKGPSATIKTHHNRVSQILDLIKEGKVIEPFQELFKDEVREIGAKLGISDNILWRQPFPGPGLAIRVLGSVSAERISILQEADAILQQEMKGQFPVTEVWQSFAILLPVKSVGVMGDERTYENVIALRIVQSVDGMTADWVSMPAPILRKISNRIINEVKGVNRVVFDVSSKPPSTIEWE